jgi:TldD protein
MEELHARALDAAVSAGASYADVRSVETSSEAIAVRGEVIESLERSESIGFGVRVLCEGAWGYAASADLSPVGAEKIARTAVEIARASSRLRRRPVELVPEPAHKATWATPLVRDPFSVPLEDKVSVLIAATASMEAVAGVRLGRGTMDFVKQKTLLSSSEGTNVGQTIVHSGAGIEAVAVRDGEVQQRSYPGSFRGDFGAGGFELVEAMNLPDHAPRTAEEAVALLDAIECPEGTTTLIVDGHQMALQVHESVGHATELDRVLGMEASFAGTSFVSVIDLNSFRYGSELVNITADATLEGGLGSFGYDDEGVAAQRTDIVRDGILVGLQSSRDTAAEMGAGRSSGTMRADGWENFPIIRMTNINLLPDEGALEDLMADVDDGLYMATNKSWSIDDKRKNFQFGCEIGWEIKKGRLTRMIKNPRYTGITPEFWASCDALAGEEEWKMWGTPNCGKGQPGQSMRVGHGTVPGRFRNVRTGVEQ